MSVMMLEPAAIGQLVAWAEKQGVKAGSIRASAYRVLTSRIVEVNRAAYYGRYKFEIEDFGFNEACRAYERFKNDIAWIKPAVIYQFAKSIEYQCCEAPDWDNDRNQVREFLRRVKLKAADKMMYEILDEDGALDAWAPDDLTAVGKKEAA